MRCVSIDKFLRLGLSLDGRYPCERQFGARQALLVLLAVNLLNYADRYVPSAVKQLIIDELHISDFESSLPATGMILVYMVGISVFRFVDCHFISPYVKHTDL